ncbi:phenylalanine--tRNA ligase subunit beta [Oligoflexus tunisiensis]|uniref:phenylalanine--tRNA ligase subunit beta n=1 Tax=Oligoflexus tunisiensis TaxID=708132 RepID=UPI000A3F66AC|nr:phenylalanine--tRNA ligase subunit beta [Oligoflexus tunisiensis]
MRISLQWLNDYIDIKDLTPEHLATELTQLGLEVEGIERIEPLKGEVVVGRILKAEQHPNADKLRVCQVSVGSGDPLKIVCGAPNARDGLRVVVARIGAVLPGDFKIKESKIRGESSFGMLCSEQELGLSESHDGIIELPESAPLGTAISQYYAMNDTVIEIGLTPNRSDCLGIIGVARDLAARLKRPLKVPAPVAKRSQESLHSASHVTVQLTTNGDSQRFCALYVRGVRAVPSPQWLQRRVQHAGMRPINLIVDATNYVMLESGQPIHAYDERDLQGKVIQVRRAKEGEELTTLDGQKRQLTATDIVIADASKAVGLAGVMGGENSEVKADTANIIIEVAHFNPVLVRKTAKRYGMHTEASHRFERGIDVQNIPWVARRVAEVIYQGAEELRGLGVDVPLPEIAGQAVDVHPQAFKPAIVALRLPRLKQITALSAINRDTVVGILESLGFQLTDHKDERLLFSVPSWRHDIEREIDLIEEVARVHGFDKIPFKLPKMEISHLPEHPLIDFLDQNKITLADCGLSEVITFPFMHAGDLENMGIKENHPLAAAVRLVNPLVETQGLLRTTMIPGLLASVLENRRHGRQGVKIFEAARTFHEPQKFNGTASAAWAHVQEQGVHIPAKARNDERPIERNRVAVILDQPYTEKSWNQPEQKVDFFHGKQILMQWTSAYGVQSLRFEPIQADDFPWLHPGAAAAIWTPKGKFFGYVGQLHPRTAKAYGLDFQHTPVVFEADLEVLLEEWQVKRSYASGSAKFPPVARDLALVVPESVTYDAFMKSFAGFKRRKYLREQHLFDVYQGTNIPAGKKSMAFSLVFQADDRTLTDKDVEKEVEALLTQLKEDLSADIR